MTGTLHRWTDDEIELGRLLTGAVIRGDRDEFERSYETAGLHSDHQLRAGVAGLMVNLAVGSLAIRRFLWRMPSPSTREGMFNSMLDSPFGDAVDIDAARAILWSAARDPVEIAVRNTDRFAQTCIVVGASTLNWVVKGQPKKWEVRYHTLTTVGRVKSGVFETFRNGADDEDPPRPSP